MRGAECGILTTNGKECTAFGTTKKRKGSVGWIGISGTARRVLENQILHY
jgi:hypothetical protein